MLQPRHFTHVVLGAALVAIPAVAGAQADTLGASASTWASMPAPGQDTALVYFERDGQRQLGMRYVETVIPAREGFLLVQQNVRPDGRLVTLDSVELEQGSLAPRWHADVTPTGRMRVTFEQGRMLGTAFDTTGSSKPIDVALGSPMLDFSAATTFIRLLPLRTGYAAVIRSYDIHRGVTHTPVRVVAEEDLELAGKQVKTWRVETTSGNGQTVTHWIDQRTRRELRVRLAVGPATMIMERTP